MKAYLRKLPGGLLAPDSDADSDALAKVKAGSVISVEWKQPRNYAFLKKFFALLNLAYDAWEPADKQYRGESVQKNFEQFRNDVTVLAGYYDTAITLKGETRLTAKSISFGSMSAEEFDALYQSVVTVVLQRILKKYTRDDLDQVIERLLQFT